MVKSEQQRQKKLAKKNAKDREKHQQLARQKAQLSSMSGQIAAASGLPSLCFVAEAVTDGSGIGSVLIARPIPRGQTVLVVFFLDMFCLGVKDVVFRTGSAVDLRVLAEKVGLSSPLNPIAPGECRSLVEAAVRYAEELGLPPPSDYRKVVGIFEGIEPLSLPDKYQFGKHGKPLYVNGPRDSEARQNVIYRALLKSVGEGNFHFLIGKSSTGGNPFDVSTDNMINKVEYDDIELPQSDEHDERPLNVIEGRVVDRIE